MIEMGDYSWSATRRIAKDVLAGVCECAYCGRSGEPGSDPDGRYWHFDHVIPRGVPGCHNPKNIVKACQSCNSRKGTKRNWFPSGTALAATGDYWVYTKDDLLDDWGGGSGISTSELSDLRARVSDLEIELETAVNRAEKLKLQLELSHEAIRVRGVILDAQREANKALMRAIDGFTGGRFSRKGLIRHMKSTDY